MTALLRVHREHVDDVGPIVASTVAVAEQLRSVRVAVGLVVDQGATERVAGLGVERFDEGAKAGCLRSSHLGHLLRRERSCASLAER